MNVFIPSSPPMSVFNAALPGQWDWRQLGGRGGRGVRDTGLTNGHERYDQLGVGNVGTSHAGPTDSLADVRVHAAHLICRRSGGS